MLLSNRSAFVPALLALTVVLSGAAVPTVATSGDDGDPLGGGGAGGAGAATGVVGEATNGTTGAVGAGTNGTDDVAAAVPDAATNATDEAVDEAVGTDSDGATDGTLDAATDAADGVTAATDEPASTATDGTASPAASERAAPVDGDELEGGVGTGILPVGRLPVDQLPATGDDAPVEPEDSPYGSDADGRLDACQLPVRTDDLPLEQVPGPSELPGDISVPVVPIDLLTPETIAQLALAVPPRPCEVYDPHDPSLDPTEPPTRPGAVAELSEVDVGPDGAEVAGGSLAIVEEDGFRGVGLAGVMATPERAGAAERLKVTDGRTSEYLYVESVGLVLVERRVVDGELRTAVFGNGFSARARCELENASAPGADDPLGPCEYDYSGLPKVITLEDLVDIVQDPPSEPPV